MSGCAVKNAVSVASAFVGQRRACGREDFLVVRAHQFRQMRKLPLVRDVRRRALHLGEFVAHVFGKVEFGQA